jgi:3-phosphoglycerate kinase
MVTAAAALEHQGPVGVVRVKEFRHGGLALLKMPESMQAAGQKTPSACQADRLARNRGGHVDTL